MRSSTASAALFALGLIGAASPGHAEDIVLPTGGTVTQGDASITGGVNSLLINQTAGSAIINWDTFSIGAGGATHFDNGSGATLNRVGGNVLSQIDGSLTATGSLFLVNPAGMVVGTGGMVATGGSFVASTHDVSDADFLNGGDTIFAGDSKAEIVNHGTISSAMGDVALIARRVENAGDISAPNGSAALLAGYDVLMHETTGANGKFAVRVGGADTEAVNSGTINAAEVELRANGGNVLALAGNTKGVIKATGVARSGARIFLTAAGGKVQTSGRVTARRRVSTGNPQQTGGHVFINADTVLASGHIDVTGLGAAGGNIDIGGRDIALQGALFDASGDTGGGRIRVGGEFQGGKYLATDEVENADTLLIDAASVLRADGTGASADGGTVIAWADGTTTFEGFVSATATGQGAGGFAEVSGKYDLDFTGLADLRAEDGTAGTILLDPTNFSIDGSNYSTIISALNSANIVVATNSAGADDGDITVDHALTYNRSNTLALLAHGDIRVNAEIQNSGSGGISLIAGWDGATDGPFSGGINNPGSVTLSDFTTGTDTFGNNDGSVFIGDGTQGDGNPGSGVAVGSRLGTTTVLAKNLTLTGSGSNEYGYAQLGYESPGSSDQASGAIDVTLTGNLTLAAGGGVAHAYAQIGHGGADDSATINSTASHAGAIMISAVDVTLTGGANRDAYAQIGHGGAGVEGTLDSDISVTATGDVSVMSTGGRYAYALIGHGGFLSGSTGDAITGNVTVDAGGDVSVIAGGGRQGFAEIGNGGNEHRGDVTGNVTVTAGGNLAVIGGTANTENFAIVGNSSVNLSAGSVSGDVTVSVNGNTIVAARNSGTSNFAMIGNGKTSNGSATVASGASLTPTGGLTMLAVKSVQINPDLTIGAGADANLIGGWDGSTGLDLTGFPVFTLADVTGGGAFGATNGDVNVNGTFLASGSTFVGAEDVTFGSTIDGALDLSITGTGVVTFDGPLGGTTELTSVLVSGGSGIALNGAAISTTGAQTYSAPITLGDDALLTAGTDVTFNSTIDGAFGLTVSSAGTNTFSGAIGSTIALTSLTVNGATNMGAGTIDVDGNTTTFNDPLTFTANLEINDTGDVYFSDIIGGFFDLTVNSGGTVTFSKGAFAPGLSVLNNLTVDAPQIAVWEDIITVLDTSLSGAVTLDTVEADRWSTIGADNITLAGSLDGDVIAFLFPRNDTFLNGTVGTNDPLKSFTITPSPTPGTDAHVVYLGGGPIVTQAGMRLGYVTELAADTTLTALNAGGRIDVSEVAGPYQLTINTPGDVLIGGAGPVVHYNGATPADPLTGLNVTAGGTTLLTYAYGEYFRVNGNMSFGGPVQLQTEIAMDATGNVNFFNTIDSGSNGTKYLTVSTPGQIYIGELVGASSSLDYLTLSGSHIAIGADIETLHAQTYNGPTTLNGAINFTATDADGDISFSGTVDSLDTNQFLKANAAGDITFGGKVGGTKLVSLLEATAGGTIFVNGGLVATKGSQTYNDQVSVAGTVFASTAGSLNFNAGVITTLPNNDVWFLAADDIRFGGSAQWAGSGNMTLVAGWNAATDGSTGWVLGDTTADTAILDDAGNFGQGTGDISIGTGTQTAGISVGSRDGTTTALAQNMYVVSSTSDDGYAQLGFRGAATGDIDVILTEDLTTLTAAGLRSFVQIGHGGYNDDNNHSGDISINVGEGLQLSGGGSTQTYALIGHGGFGSDGNNSGAIDLAIAEGLTVRGGAGTDAFAQIGHGDASFNSSGTRMGAVSTVVGGITAMTDETGGAWFGHATTTGDGVSNANVALVTTGLNTIGISPVTTGLGDFAGMLQYNLLGGNVLIANRLAAATPDAGGFANQGFDDIIFTGPNFGYFSSPFDLSLIAGGDVVMLSSVQNQVGTGDLRGQGNINLVGGWDGVEGLELTASPALTMSDIRDNGAFGVTGGDIYIGDGSQDQNIVVGTRQGDIQVLAHDLEVKGSFPTPLGIPDDGFFARLGFESGPEPGIHSDITIDVMDDVIVEGGEDSDAWAIIGHDNVESDELFGDITIRGDTANDNVIAVLGGSGLGSFAQIGHEGCCELITGNISIFGEDIVVQGGTNIGADAQIGHFWRSATGGITVQASGFFDVIGGDAPYTYAQVGHSGTGDGGSTDTISGDINITVGIDSLISGGGVFESDAQVGHGGTLADISGAITFNVGGNLDIWGGFDEDTPAYIGHAGISGSATGDIDVDVGETLTLWGSDFDDAWAQIGHSINAGANSGQIDVNAKVLDLLAGNDDESYAQIGHGDAAIDHSGTREGDINVVVTGEATLEDNGNGLAWIGHGTTTAGGTTNANVFLQAFGFDRDSGSTLASGDLGRFNKDIILGDIPSGDFTLIATGTGLLLEDPAYNSPNQLLIWVNNDLVLDVNATYSNAGAGDIIFAAGGDFHNDTGSLTPITTGGRWLVYSTRPDNNRNDIEITNWDFLRYATTFDINNPLVGTGSGLIYSVAPVVNFTVSNEAVTYGDVISPTITQTLTVNGIQVNADAFGLGINPATAQWAMAPFVTIDSSGNPVVGFYGDGLTTSNETIPYFGMTFVSNPGDLTVAEATTIVHPATNPPTAASMGIGEMCAFRSDDEDPEEGGERYDRIIELCGIIESDKDQ